MEGLEPPTTWLTITRSTNWATSDKYNFSKSLMRIESSHYLLNGPDGIWTHDPLRDKQVR